MINLRKRHKSASKTKQSADAKGACKFVVRFFSHRNVEIKSNITNLECTFPLDSLVRSSILGSFVSTIAINIDTTGYLVYTDDKNQDYKIYNVEIFQSIEKGPSEYYYVFKAEKYRPLKRVTSN